jgi:tRNA A-37 threonylcarbamoyl transferase component Bud32
MERLKINSHINIRADRWSIQHIEMIYASGTIITQKPAQEVKLCHDGDIPYIIKKYLSKNIFQSLRELLGKARSDKSFNSALTLQALSIPIPNHYMVAKQISVNRSTSYLVMERAPGTPLIKFLQSGNFDDLPAITELHIIDIVETFHNANLAHGDLHTRNLIIANDGSVSLIDLDNVEKSPSRIRRDVRRLHQALIDYPNPMHKLQQYLAIRLEITSS